MALHCCLGVWFSSNFYCDGSARRALADIEEAHTSSRAPWPLRRCTQRHTDPLSALALPGGGGGKCSSVSKSGEPTLYPVCGRRTGVKHCISSQEREGVIRKTVKPFTVFDQFLAYLSCFSQQHALILHSSECAKAFPAYGLH